MLKTEEVIALEQSWTELKNKRTFAKFVIFFVVLLLILSALLLYLVIDEKSKVSTNIVKDPQHIVGVVSLADTPNVTNMTTATVDATNNSTPVTDSTRPVTEGQNINININLDTLTARVSKDNENLANISNENILPETANHTTISHQQISIPDENRIVIETNTIQNVDTLIGRFEATDNIVFANMISEEYFVQKDYQKSLEWALIANEKDPSNELSWIMFAKNQVKLGNKDDAIRALEGFVSYAKNATLATNLLQRIKTGDIDNF